MELPEKFVGELVCLNRFYVKRLCLLPDCTMGVDTVSDWETVSLPNIVKQKACKSGLQAMLIRHTNWESECAYTQNERD